MIPWFCIHYSAWVGVRSIVINPSCLSVCVCVCLSTSISLEPMDRFSQNFVGRSPVVVARFSFGGVALRYVLLVLWMTPHFSVMSRMAMRGRLTLDLLPVVPLRYWGGVWCLWMPCYSAPVRMWSIVINPSLCAFVCLSASISLESLDWSSQNFVCRSPVVVARSSCGGVALRYVLPVLWMTSCLVVMGRMALHGWSERLAGLAISYICDRGAVWCLWMPGCVL